MENTDDMIGMISAGTQIPREYIALLVSKHKNEKLCIWDQIAKPILLQLLAENIRTPMAYKNNRWKVAVYYIVKSSRQVLILSKIFEQGYYVESIPLIRCAYEDWLRVANILLVDGNEPADAFNNSWINIDAKNYQTFLLAFGDAATKDVFVSPPQCVIETVKLNEKIFVNNNFRNLAKNIGLEKQHDFIYSYLSNYAHGSIVNRVRIFDDKDGINIAKIPNRELDEENQLALWSYWFFLRIATITGREFGKDYELYSNTLIELFQQKISLSTCVFNKEYLKL